MDTFFFPAVPVNLEVGLAWQVAQLVPVDDTAPAEAVCGQTGSFIMGRRRHASPFV